MTKIQIDEKIKQIKVMDRVEVLAFDMLVSKSMLDADTKSKLTKAIKDRLQETKIELDPIAVEGEGDKPC
jgi:hypothetical protein